MFGDDSVADAQTEASALADRLGSVEGVENARRICYAGAAIRELNEEMGAFHARFHPKIALRAFFQDGVDGVIDEVQEDLLELVGIRGRMGKIRSEIQMHAVLAHAQVIIAQGKCVFEDGVYEDGDAFRFVLTREAQQILHDAVGALRLLVELFSVTEGLRPHFPA